MGTSYTFGGAGVGCLFGGCFGSLLGAGASYVSRRTKAEILRNATTAYAFGGIVGGASSAVAIAVVCDDAAGDTCKNKKL